jgi:hypothetical protein
LEQPRFATGFVEKSLFSKKMLKKGGFYGQALDKKVRFM